MTAYIECFVILGQRYGIEDHEDGRPKEDHFFPHRYRSGQSKRFHLWRGGGGFGQADTLEQARQKLFDYAKQNIESKRLETKQELEITEAQLKCLGDDSAHLFRFEEPE
jgi:hypothetical protein